MDGRYDICERNTFLDFPAPKPLPLEKAQTDPPPGLEGIYSSRKFVSENWAFWGLHGSWWRWRSPSAIAIRSLCDARLLRRPGTPWIFHQSLCLLQHLHSFPINSQFCPWMRHLNQHHHGPESRSVLEEMLGGLDNLGPDASTLVPMPVAGGEPQMVTCTTSHASTDAGRASFTRGWAHFSSLAGPLAGQNDVPWTCQVPAEIAVAGPNLPENELQPGQLVCQVGPECFRLQFFFPLIFWWYKCFKDWSDIRMIWY